MKNIKKLCLVAMLFVLLVTGCSGLGKNSMKGEYTIEYVAILMEGEVVSTYYRTNSCEVLEEKVGETLGEEIISYCKEASSFKIEIIDEDTMKMSYNGEEHTFEYMIDENDQFLVSPEEIDGIYMEYGGLKYENKRFYLPGQEMEHNGLTYKLVFVFAKK